MFSLGVGDAAAYEWGSCFVTLRYAPYGKDVQRRVLGTLLEDVVQFQSAAEFRATIAFLHELAHYLQDVTTGVGYSDHVTRSKLTYELKSTMSSEWPLDAIQHTLLDELVFIPNSRWTVSRTARFREQTAAILRSDDDEGVLPPFTPENLLEAEAAAYVFLQVQRLKGSSEQKQMVTDQEYLFYPGRMGDAYQVVMSEFLGVVNHLTGEDVGRLFTERDRGLEFFEVFLRWLVFFIDLSLAYPTPEVIAGSGGDRAQYEPGVKFARLISTFGNFDAQQHKKFTTAFVENNFDEAEAIVLTAMAYRYPHSREIYSAWEEFLRRWQPKMPPAGSPPAPNPQGEFHLLNIRIAGCENRVADGASRVTMFKTFASAIGRKKQVFPPIMSASGMTNILIGDQILLSEEERQARWGETYLHSILTSLQDSVIFGEPFTCPIHRQCGARIPMCEKGYHTLAVLPETRGCHTAWVAPAYNIKF